MGFLHQYNTGWISLKAISIALMSLAWVFWEVLLVMVLRYDQRKKSQGSGNSKGWIEAKTKGYKVINNIHGIS